MSGMCWWCGKASPEPTVHGFAPGDLPVKLHKLCAEVAAKAHPTNPAYATPHPRHVRDVEDASVNPADPRDGEFK